MTEMTPAELLACVQATGVTPRTLRQLAQHGYDVVKRASESPPAGPAGVPAATSARTVEPTTTEPRPAE